MSCNISILYKLNFITFKVLALANALGLRFLGWIIMFIRKSPLIESGYLFDIWNIGGGATHARGSLIRDRLSIRAFTMHLAIIFRYKVTNNTNIFGTISKRYLSHVKTKNDLTIYLAKNAVTNFKNVNGGYAVSYTTKCISNLEDFAQEMMTHNHGEADMLQLMYQQETVSQSFTYTPQILMYFFLLFTSIQHFVQIQHSRLVR